MSVTNPSDIDEQSPMLKTITPNIGTNVAQSQSHSQSYTIKREHHSKLTLFFCIILTIGAGMLHSTQAGLNILLRYELNNQALRSSFVSFTVGSLSLFPFLCVDCTNSTIPKCSNLFKALNINKIEYLLFLNGILGAFYVTAVIFVGPIIGLALYFICVVLGQMIVSTVFDYYDKRNAHTLRHHIIRFSGILLLVTGVVVCEIDTLNHVKDSGSEWYEVIGYCFIGVLAGFAGVIRAFMNRRFEYHLQSSYFAAIPNFVGGAVVCCVAALIQWAFVQDGLLTDGGSGIDGSNAYIWFGGVCGSIYLVIVSIIMPSYLGYVGSYICAICGNLTMSTVYDTIGLFAASQELTGLRVFGIVLVFVAVIGVNIPQMMKYCYSGEDGVSIGKEMAAVTGVAVGKLEEDSKETVPLVSDEMAQKNYDGIVHL